MSKGKDKPLKFEESITQVEAILERIESGRTGLEDSLLEYEKGMKLIAHCRAVLDTAEQKIAELTVNGNGSLCEENTSDVSAEV